MNNRSVRRLQKLRGGLSSKVARVKMDSSLGKNEFLFSGRKLYRRQIFAS
jgi:hypothetical protein